MTGPSHVLVPTLGRPREDDALAYAIEQFPEAKVTLLAVVTPLDAPLSEGGVLERDEARTEQTRANAEATLESAVGSAAADRVRIDLVEGRPGTVVPAYARDANADHVVMQGHDAGTKGLARRLLGRSIAATVVDRTAAPVTVLD
ncbi:universal stress protein [Halobacteria archaeon AArc-dxtr1]|nr:universal stress protein [Halobacteria archaeon AArc-dxtr1]